MHSVLKWYKKRVDSYGKLMDISIAVLGGGIRKRLENPGLFPREKSPDQATETNRPRYPRCRQAEFSRCAPRFSSCSQRGDHLTACFDDVDGIEMVLGQQCGCPIKHLTQCLESHVPSFTR